MIRRMPMIVCVSDSLLMGRYIVAISGSNFAPGGALAKGFASRTGDGNSYDPVNGPYEDRTNANWMDQTTDNNDNGSLMNAPGSPIDGLIASDTIDLGDVPEPLAENPYNDTTVTDDHNNLTIDFWTDTIELQRKPGLSGDATTMACMTGGTEVPLDSVEVVLHWYNELAMSCVALDTTLTDGTGRYLFGYLLEGKYIIEITAKNFQAGGALQGFASSTAGYDLTSGPHEGGNPTLTDGDRDVDDVDLVV
ncbi:MAG: hypothetical protein IPF93_22120 [Saprospiraceae bacterium]|nr:hypothetical protein [Saprospiraceae bacterium]